MSKIDFDQLTAAIQQHCDSALSKTPAEIYRVDDDRWRLTSSTFVENWPVSLHRLSVKSGGFPLSELEARVLGSCMGEYAGGFDVSDIPPEDHLLTRANLIQKIDQIIKGDAGGEAFVRLGSRSPKDAWGPNWSGDMKKGLVRSGKEAFQRLTGDSERIYVDLQTALAMGYEPWIWVRKWTNLAPWQEFRCFMRNRELVGISQYDYNLGRLEEVVTNCSQIKTSISEFFGKFLKSCQHESVVFDVIVQPGPDGYQTSLLEINPYFGWTDPCLFSWDELKLVRNEEFRFSMDEKSTPGNLFDEDGDFCQKESANL